jgi:hypothetical protein
MSKKWGEKILAVVKVVLDYNKYPITNENELSSNPDKLQPNFVSFFISIILDAFNKKFYSLKHKNLNT